MGTESFQSDTVCSAVDESGTERTTTRKRAWLDNLLETLQAALVVKEGLVPGAAVELKDGDRYQIKSILVNLAIEFCWAGHVKLDDKIIVSWSSLREKLRTMLSDRIMKGKAMEGESLCGSEVVSLLLQGLGCTTGCDVGGSGSGSVMGSAAPSSQEVNACKFMQVAGGTDGVTEVTEFSQGSSLKKTVQVPQGLQEHP